MVAVQHLLKNIITALLVSRNPYRRRLEAKHSIGKPTAWKEVHTLSTSAHLCCEMVLFGAFYDLYFPTTNTYTLIINGVKPLLKNG